MKNKKLLKDFISTLEELEHFAMASSEWDSAVVISHVRNKYVGLFLVGDSKKKISRKAERQLCQK